jgi:hypothetical protein
MTRTAQAFGVAPSRASMPQVTAKPKAGTTDLSRITIEHSVARTEDGKTQDVISCQAKDWPAIRASHRRFHSWSVATFGLTVIAVSPIKEGHNRFALTRQRVDENPHS